MNETDFLREAWDIYENVLAERNNDDYVVNFEQMKKLKESYDFFAGLVEECGGEIEPLKLVPKEINGGVTVYMTLLYLSGENLKKFNDIVGNMSAVSIDAMDNGDVCISFTIPAVFKHK